MERVYRGLTDWCRASLPLEIFGMTTPVLYALGTLTTGFSFVVILCGLVVVRIVAARRA